MPDYSKLTEAQTLLAKFQDTTAPGFMREYLLEHRGLPALNITGMREETLRKIATLPAYARTVFHTQLSAIDAGHAFQQHLQDVGAVAKWRAKLSNEQPKPLPPSLNELMEGTKQTISQRPEQRSAEIEQLRQQLSSLRGTLDKVTESLVTEETVLKAFEAAKDGLHQEIDNILQFAANGVKEDISNAAEQALEKLREDAKEIARPIQINLVQPDGQIQKTTLSHKHEIFEKVLRTVNAGLHALVIGPAGSGKSTLAEQIAQALFLDFEFTGAVSNEFKLLGFKDAHGEYHDTPFFRAFTEGKLFLFDEIDGSHPQALLTFNQALANFKLDFPHGCFSAHENFRCIAAANTWGLGASREYVGRNQLDAATLDRFIPFEMDYDEHLERLLGAEQPEWTEFVLRTRQRARQQQVRHIISTRAIINGIKLSKAGMESDEIERAVLWKGLDAGTIESLRR